MGARNAAKSACMRDVEARSPNNQPFTLSRSSVCTDCQLGIGDRIGASFADTLLLVFFTHFPKPLNERPFQTFPHAFEQTTMEDCINLSQLYSLASGNQTLPLLVSICQGLLNACAKASNALQAVACQKVFRDKRLTFYGLTVCRTSAARFFHGCPCHGFLVFIGPLILPF